MRRNIIWLIGILGLLILQTAVLLPLGVGPVNLLLVLVVVSLLFAGFDFGLGLAVGAGVILDFLSGAPDGIFALTFVVVFLLLYFIINNVLSREPNLLILFSSVAASTISYFIFLMIFNQLFKVVHLGSEINWRAVVLSDLPWSLFFNLLATYPVSRYYLAFENFNQRFIKNAPQSIQT